MMECRTCASLAYSALTDLAIYALLLLLQGLVDLYRLCQPIWLHVRGVCASS